MKKSGITTILLFPVLVTMLVSCKGETNIIMADSIDSQKISITFTTEYSHEREGFLYPGEKIFINYVRADNKGTVDKTKTVIWTFSQTTDGENFTEYVSKDGWEASIAKSFTDEGTYNIRADLYDTGQYQSIGNGTPVISTDEIQFIVEAADLLIESEEIDKRVIQFKPKILNPEIGLVYTGLRMHFGDNTIEEFEGKIPESIMHSYETEGFYNITAELFFKAKFYDLILTKSEKTIRVKGNLYIISLPEPLKTDTEYTFQALQVETLTSKPKYKWAFGDGKISKILSTDAVTHSYVQPGSYTLHVDLIDGETKENIILASTNLTIEIEESGYFLSELQQMKKFDLVFTVQQDYIDHTSGIFKWDCGSGGALIWDGTHFSLDWSKDTHSEHLTGRVSEDGTILEHLIVRHEFVDFNRTTQWYELITMDLPLSLNEAPNRFSVDKQGTELSTFVTSFNTYITEGYQWTKNAELHIKFEKR